MTYTINCKNVSRQETLGSRTHAALIVQIPIVQIMVNVIVLPDILII